MNLTLGQHRIDDVADVLDDGVAHDLQRARVRIDLDFAHVAAIRERDGGWLELAGGGQPIVAGLLGVLGDFRQRQRAVGPGEAEMAVGELDVLELGVEHVGGDLPALGDRVVERDRHAGAADADAAGTTVAAAPWEEIGVALDIAHLVDADAQSFRHEI